MEETTPPHPQTQKHIFIITGITFLLLVGFISTFFSGFYISNLLSHETHLPATPTPTPYSRILPSPSNFVLTITPSPGVTLQPLPQDSTKFLPGKFYFEDTALLITRDSPQRTFIATVTRLQQDKGYIQNTRVSFFDGENWTRLGETAETSDDTIVSGGLVKLWNVSIDPSRVLKETINGAAIVKANQISYSSNQLQNEIGMRSLPGYTKFMSAGTGTLTINSVKHDAYVLYTHLYSLNASDIQFYSTPFGLTTDWIAFWDKNGNFYHVDDTTVDKPTPNYSTHQIGVLESASGSVTKTFGINVTRDTQVPPKQYTITLRDPVNAVLNLTVTNAVNKAPNGSYTWYMGNITGYEGSNSSSTGTGLMEYIHN